MFQVRLQVSETLLMCNQQDPVQFNEQKAQPSEMSFFILKKFVTSLSVPVGEEYFTNFWVMFATNGAAIEFLCNGPSTVVIINLSQASSI